MSTFDDLVSALMLEAGKTGDNMKDVATLAIRSAIEIVNDTADFVAIKTRKKDLSLTANAHTLSLPKRVKRIIEIGEYDSTTDRIKVPWTESDESDFHAELYGNDSIESTEAGSSRFWFFRDNENDGDHEIRVYPPSSATLTVCARFYEELTDGNMHLLPNRSLIRSGAKANLSGWFPQTAALEYRQFYDGMERLRSKRGSIKLTGRQHQRPDVAVHNAAAADMV